MLNTQKI